MSHESDLLLKALGLAVLICVGYFRPRLVARSFQAIGTAAFSGLAVYGLVMVVMGKTNSFTGGLLYVAGAAALAFVSFNLFGWIARSR